MAVSDSQGGIYKEDRFDVPSLAKVKNGSRALKGICCEGAICEMVKHGRITNDELLERDVNVLSPAALDDRGEEHSISSRLVAYVRSLSRMGKAVESQGTHEDFNASQ